MPREYRNQVNLFCIGTHLNMFTRTVSEGHHGSNDIHAQSLQNQAGKELSGQTPEGVYSYVAIGGYYILLYSTGYL